MNLRDITKNPTAKSLNESLARRFGKKINLEAFTLEQLEDARNKVRTQLRDIETNESFSSVATDTYQKTKLFHDVLNAAIAEAAKPDYIDIDKDGDKKEPMKKAAKDAKKKKQTNEDKAKKQKQAKADNMWGQGELQGDAPHSQFMRSANADASRKRHMKGAKRKDRIAQKHAPKPGDFYSGVPSRDLVTHPTKKESMDEGKQIIEKYFNYACKLVEGEEDKAEIVMASKDMVDRVTGWMEDTAEMQTESMLELADAIRDEMGQQMSDNFTQTVKPALEAMYGVMETTRASLTQGVGMLTGESEPVDTMGADDEMPAEEPAIEPTIDQDDAGDDFATAEPAVGGEEEAGREKRESIERSRRLGILLSK